MKLVWVSVCLYLTLFFSFCLLTAVWNIHTQNTPGNRRTSRRHREPLVSSWNRRKNPTNMQWKLFNSPPNEFLPDFRSWLIEYFSNFRIGSALKSSSWSKSVGLVQINANWSESYYLHVKTFTWSDEEKDEGCCCVSRHDWAGLQLIRVWEKSRQAIKTSDWCEGRFFYFQWTLKRWVKISSVSFLFLSFIRSVRRTLRPFNKIFKKPFCCFELSGFIVKRAETDQLVKQTVGEIVGGKVVQVCLRVGILSD